MQQANGSAQSVMEIWKHNEYDSLVRLMKMKKKTFYSKNHHNITVTWNTIVRHAIGIVFLISMIEKNSEWVKKNSAIDCHFYSYKYCTLQIQIQTVVCAVHKQWMQKGI